MHIFKGNINWVDNGWISNDFHSFLNFLFSRLKSLLILLILSVLPDSLNANSMTSTIGQAHRKVKYIIS